LKTKKSTLCEIVKVYKIPSPKIVFGIDNKVIIHISYVKGLRKKVITYLLRQNFAIYFLEKGIYLKCIQELLGHKNSKTTKTYTHVSIKILLVIKRPNLITISGRQEKFQEYMCMRDPMQQNGKIQVSRC